MKEKNTNPIGGNLNDQNDSGKVLNKHKQNGITLIALIITIIVMLILVSVSITAAVNGGLFKQAGNAVKDYGNAQNEEYALSDGNVTIDGTSTEIQYYVDTVTGKYILPEGASLKSEKNPINDAEMKRNGILTENGIYTDTKNSTATIPAGFRVVSDSTTNNEALVSKGLVIEDSKGNQFVWIPVEVKSTDKATSIASFYRSEWASNERTTGLSINYTEPYAYENTEEVEDYNKMLASVYKYKGFYIGRYEAGTTTPRKYAISNATTEMVVKRDAYPYNYVGWGASMSDYTADVTDSNEYNQGKGAVWLSKNMYASSTSVASTLCYGVQWDAMLDFIKDAEHDVTNSTAWGNYSESTYTSTPTSKYSSNSGKNWTEAPHLKTESEAILLTTGAVEKNKTKNIYDVAGNVWEWTLEAFSSENRVYRGGCYASNASTSSASKRSYGTPKRSYDLIGFRCALYIK